MTAVPATSATAAEIAPDSASLPEALPDPEWAMTIPFSEISAILDPADTLYSKENDDLTLLKYVISY